MDKFARAQRRAIFGNAAHEQKIGLTSGDVIIIPAGVKHRFKNESERNAVTFNVYSPPEYPADTNG